MGNKAQAKASSAWAARAKKDGFPIRRETRCHCGKMISLRAVGRHNCPGRAFSPSRGLPTTEKQLFKASLNQIVGHASFKVSLRSDREKEIIRQIDRSINFPTTLPSGWRGVL